MRFALLATITLTCAAAPAAAAAEPTAADIQARQEAAAADERAFAELASHLESAAPALREAKASFVAAMHEARRHDAAGAEQEAILGRTRGALAAAVAGQVDVAKLQALGAKAAEAAAEDGVADLRAAVSALGDVAGEITAAQDKQRRLQQRLAGLRPQVEAQEDGAEKTRNQALLAEATRALDDLDKRIAGLAAARANAQAAAMRATGEADGERAAATAQRLVRDHDRARRRQRDLASLIDGITGIAAAPTASCHGAVTIERAGADPLAAGDGRPVVLQPGDRVVTGPGAGAMLRLEDGSAVQLGERSTFIADAPDRSLGGTLKRGTLRLFDRFASGRAQVRTPTAVAAVRGTDVCVEVDDRSTILRVGSGSVVVSRDGVEDVEVKAGQRLTLKAGAGGAPEADEAEAYAELADRLGR